MARLDPRIGQLVTGKYYCFPDGYDKPELVGTLEEVEGIAYRGIRAPSKAKANALARKQAERDGHLGGGKGRVWLSAELETG